ncbi:MULTISPECIES: PepSY1/2 domain-containing protein [Lysinibacillus]|uniref:Sporulation protein n=1 Tax=Lysinibacillus boronitolerans JCM 21713 = 10a = NBRC 103108 TaxID=1294264 RepID=A0ABR4XU33_9BACI|nr:PepSY1/2 domain-containing protein [Lysinibacillus boronitolerans]KGR81098.1 sporulation protein [Lysinibacillus boronitolerans JCM 21713 = 10a = NBRC 103108]MCS1393429.1 germination protein YpeB [Lysinibacillus boronitolerans]
MKTWLVVLTIAVIGLGAYSIDLHGDKEDLQRTVLAQYTDKLTDASEKLSHLQRSVSQSLLFQDEQAIHNELDSVWRLSSEVRSSIANIPIGQELSSEWMNYLGRLGDEAKRTAKTGDYEAWRKKMPQVSTNLQSLSDEWTAATVDFYKHDGKMDVWLQQVDNKNPNTQFDTVKDTLKGYGEKDFPLTLSESDWQKKIELKALQDAVITEKEALEKVKYLFPVIKDATFTVTKSSDTAPYPFYHIQFHQGIRLGYVDLTEKGGHLLSYLVERPVDEAKLSQEEVLKKAQEYVKRLGMKDVAYVESRENHQAWHVTFARVHPGDNALIYADGVQLKVAKDTGELLGANAMEYIQEENIKKQTAKPIDWKTFFQDDIQVQEVKNIYTDNGQFEQRLCYEVIALRDGNTQETFRIVIDAENHNVLKVEYLT